MKRLINFFKKPESPREELEQIKTGLIVLAILSVIWGIVGSLIMLGVINL